MLLVFCLGHVASFLSLVIHIKIDIIFAPSVAVSINCVITSPALVSDEAGGFDLGDQQVVDQGTLSESFKISWRTTEGEGLKRVSRFQPYRAARSHTSSRLSTANEHQHEVSQNKEMH